MTDHAPTDDELLSSYLDGEATPDEVDRIEADPSLLARAASLRAASELVATPVTPLAAGAAERLIETALAAGAASDDVIDLRAETMRRQRIRQRLVTVAAGVLLLGIAVPLLFAISSSTNGDSDTASDAPAPEEVSDDDAMALDLAGSDAAFADEADGEAPMAAEPAEEGDADMGAAESFDEAPDDSGDTATRTIPEGAFILPGGLGPYDTAEDLVEEFEEIWRTRADDDTAEPLPASTTTTLFNALPCGFAFVDFFAGTDALVDLTVVTIDDGQFVAALADLGDGRGVIGLADPDDCAIDEIAELAD